MLNVSDYIELLLKKMGLSRTDLCREINRVEARLGEKRTTPQNINSYFKGEWAFRPKILAKWEVALRLPEGTLMNMVMPPLTKEGKDELSKTIEELRKLR